MEKQESNVLNFPLRGGEPDSTMHVDCNMSAWIYSVDFLLMMCGDCLLLRQINMQLELENGVLTWQVVTTDEMKAFIGILILMVTCHLPRLRVYWTKKHPYIRPAISKIMFLTTFE